MKILETDIYDTQSKNFFVNTKSDLTKESERLSKDLFNERHELQKLFNIFERQKKVHKILEQLNKILNSGNYNKNFKKDYVNLVNSLNSYNAEKLDYFLTEVTKFTSRI